MIRKALSHTVFTAAFACAVPLVVAALVVFAAGLAVAAVLNEDYRPPQMPGEDDLV